MVKNFDIQNNTTLRPKVSFAKIKETILGSQYELSLVLIGDTLGRRLNLEHKKKNTPTNVLSFPIDKKEGEIFINVRRAKRDAKKFDHKVNEHIAFLFIHGCLHLKGEKHGSKMEKKEERLLQELFA